MKKIAAVLLAALMAAGMMTGCSGDSGKKIAGKDDLVGARIGVQEGTTGDGLVTDIADGVVERDDDGNVVKVDEEMKNAGTSVARFKKAVDAALDLKNGKLDAVVVDALPAQKIVASTQGLKVLDVELSEEEYCIAVRKGDEELLKAINATIARMREDGTYDSLTQAFMPEEGDVKVLDTPLPKGDDTIVMGTNAEFEPFEYHYGESIVGFDIEMAKEIAKDLGKTLVIEDMNFDSLIGALQTGKIDFIAAGMTATAERRENVDFSDCYFNASQVIIVKE